MCYFLYPSLKISKDDSLMIFITTVVLLISLLATFSFYYFDNLNVFCYGLYFLFCSYFFLKKSRVFDRKNNMGFAIGFASVWFFVYLFNSLITNVPFSGTFYILWGFFFLLTRDDLKVKIFNFFLRCISLFLLIAIIEFVFFIITGKGYELGVVVREQIYYDQHFIHLLFNMVRVESIPRFLCLANEPGVIGTLCGFLIYLIKYKKGQRLPFIVIWISGFISLSLAFFILASIRVIISLFFSVRKFTSLLVLSFSLTILSLGYFYFEDTISYVILDRFDNPQRLERDESGNLHKLFERAMNDGSILWGHEGDSGAGAEGWVYHYGLVSLLVVFLLYFSVFRKLVGNYNSDKFSSFLFFIVFWLSFYQRQYIIYPTYVLSFFVCPLIFAKQDSISKTNEWQ